MHEKQRIIISLSPGINFLKTPSPYQMFLSKKLPLLVESWFDYIRLNRLSQLPQKKTPLLGPYSSTFSNSLKSLSGYLVMMLPPSPRRATNEAT